MSRIRANQITNKTADGATTATNGFNVTGVCTATSFSGNGSSLTGISTAGGALGLDFNDDVKVRFGNTNDLVIFYENSGATVLNEWDTVQMHRLEMGKYLDSLIDS